MYIGLEDQPTGGEAVVRRSTESGVLYGGRDLFEAERSLAEDFGGKGALAGTLIGAKDALSARLHWHPGLCWKTSWLVVQYPAMPHLCSIAISLLSTLTFGLCT